MRPFSVEAAAVVETAVDGSAGEITTKDMAAAFAAARTTPGSSPPVGSIPHIIGTVNGQQWLNRCERMNKFSMPAIVRQHTNLKEQNCNTDLTGSGVYAKEVKGQEETRYDIVNS